MEKRPSEYITEFLNFVAEAQVQHRLYEEEPWYTQGMRFFPVGNYRVFYVPDETATTVNILRIMYRGRDLRKQLEGN